MPDFKVVRSWVRFRGKDRKSTYHHLTEEGQKQALIVPHTSTQGIYNEAVDSYCYSFHFEFHPEMFEDKVLPRELEPLYDIAERRVREEYVVDADYIDLQFSCVIPGQYIDSGKVKL